MQIIIPLRFWRLPVPSFRLKLLELSFGIWILVFGLCFLTGCGSSKKGIGNELERVTLRLNGELGVQYAGYYTALTKGFYLQEGLEVKINPSDWEDAPEEYILSGNETFGVTWLPNLLVSRDKGKPLVHIAQIFQRSGLRIIAKKSSGIQEPTDLIHKRLGLWSKNREYGIMTFLTLAGLDANIVKLLPQKKTIKPFLENQVDAIPVMVYDGYITLLEKGIDTTALTIFDAATPLEVSGQTLPWGLLEDGIFVTEKTLHEQPELCERFLRATLKGWQYALDNPGEAVEIVLSYDTQNILKREHELAGLREIIKLIRPELTTMSLGEPTAVKKSYPLGYLNLNEFNRCVELLRKQGYLTQDASSTAYTHAIWEKSRK
ncbi:MAG: ABC transporter substrate-binding protein [bacterium]|nr:ABC transporter substrate-binding protein [bacterium]